MPHIVDDESMNGEAQGLQVPHVVPSLLPTQREVVARDAEPILSQLGGVPSLEDLGSILDPYAPPPITVPKED